MVFRLRYSAYTKKSPFKEMSTILFISEKMLIFENFVTPVMKANLIELFPVSDLNVRELYYF